MSLEVSNDPTTRFLPRTLEEMLAGWIRRAGGLAIIACAGIAWLALLTWSIHDPSFSHATSETSRNALGLPGRLSG